MSDEEDFDSRISAFQLLLRIFEVYSRFIESSTQVQLIVSHKNRKIYEHLQITLSRLQTLRDTR